MEWYCSCVSNFIAFKTSHERGFLVFGVSFGTPDGNACPKYFSNLQNSLSSRLQGYPVDCKTKF